MVSDSIWVGGAITVQGTICGLVLMIGVSLNRGWAEVNYRTQSIGPLQVSTNHKASIVQVLNLTLRNL